MQYSVKFVKNFIVKQFKNSTHKIILSRIEKKVFLNQTLKALNISFKKVVLHGRVKRDGTEGEIVVAHGRLPSSALKTNLDFKIKNPQWKVINIQL